jgi:DNA polymerase-3 subunit beta
VTATATPPQAPASFACDVFATAEAVATAQSVVPSRSPKPVLLSVRLDVDPEAGTTVSATDLECGLRLRVVGVKADAPCSLLLPPARLLAILRGQVGRNDELTFEVSSGDGPGTLVVRGKGARFEIPLEDPALFPNVPRFASADFEELAAADLKRLIRHTHYATDVESTRYALGGALVEAGAGELAMVATDGRRLARQVVPASTVGKGAPRGGTPVVPLKAMKLLDRLCGDDDPPVHLTFDKAGLYARTESAEVHSRLVEGRYPRYQDVLPADTATRLKVGTTAGELLWACEQAAIMTGDESRGVDFAFGDGTVTLSSMTSDRGSGSVEAAVATEGAPLTITFDVRYLADALRRLDRGAAVRWRFADEHTGAVLTDDRGFTYLVMPLTRDR